MYSYLVTGGAPQFLLSVVPLPSHSRSGASAPPSASLAPPPDVGHQVKAKFICQKFLSLGIKVIRYKSCRPKDICTAVFRKGESLLKHTQPLVTWSAEFLKATEGTLELFGLMYQHVSLQLVPAIEGSLTEVAVKGLLPRVYQLVELQGILRLELLGAFLQR